MIDTLGDRMKRSDSWEAEAAPREREALLRLHSL